MSVSKVTPFTSGPNLHSQPPPSSHVVHFYEEDPALIAELVRLIGNDLTQGESAIVVATGAHRDALALELSVRGLDVRKLSAEGRYTALDAEQILSRVLVDQMPDRAKFRQILGDAITKAAASATSPEPCIVIFGEMVALLWSSGKHEAAICLEQFWNDLAKTHSFYLRCAYPMEGFNRAGHSESFMKICAEHSAVIPSGRSGLELSADERLRTIATLQQKVEVLESEKALRESEQRFRLLVEAVQDYAIFMLDPEGRVSSWNIGAERLKGYKASEIIGRHFSEFYPELDKQAGKPQRELETATREGRLEDEGWRLRQDGSRFWANVVITALKDADGRLRGFAKVTRDFTDRMQAERELRESKRKLEVSEKSLRELSLHLLRTQDEERRRIGRDLHDSLGQYLSVLKMKLDSLHRFASQTQSQHLTELSECAQLTDDAVKEVRTISYLLYPPMLEEMGLKSAIPWYLDGFTKRSGIKTTFEASPEFGRLSPDIELAFFRVLQESLTNVHRHSGSPTAIVRLRMENDAASLAISDEGKGAKNGNFEEGRQDWMGALGVGLRGMSERMNQIGGKLEIASSKAGTTVTGTVPVPKASATATT